MAEHAELSPSNGSRWMNCPGSVALCATMPKPASSKYAVEGTAAHIFLERCLKDPTINPYDLVGDEIEDMGYEVTEEMADAISFSLDYIRTEIRVKGGELVIESKVDIIGKTVYGRLDAAIIREYDTIIVIDFKYGKGVLVSATDNVQLLLYGLGLMRRYEAPTMRLVVLQPRTEGMISTWYCDEKYMVAFEKEVKRKIKLTKEKNALTSAGDWCKWCYAKTICPSLKKDLRDSLPAIPGKELLFPDVRGLSVDNMVMIMEKKALFTDWLSAVCAYAQEFVEAGGVIPGYDLAQKRAHRKWANEKEALKTFTDLGEDAFTVKVKSPAQMEKIAGKERVAPLTFTPDTGMTLKKVKEEVQIDTGK